MFLKKVEADFKVIRSLVEERYETLKMKIIETFESAYLDNNVHLNGYKNTKARIEELINLNPNTHFDIIRK